MSDWDAVKQLAAEFQKVQASTGAQKLSERNCVEVVSKLVAMGLLEVLHTVDGKEYLTPQQLEREIRDELTVNKGEDKINLIIKDCTWISEIRMLVQYILISASIVITSKYSNVHLMLR